MECLLWPFEHNKELVSADADINHTNKLNQTALFTAALKEEKILLNFL